MQELKKKSTENTRNITNDLVLSIDQNGKIKKFNEECEKISGYNKNYVINKDFFDLLTPETYQMQWRNIFNSIKKNKIIEDFKLPLLTHNKHEIMISWSSFPVTNKDGVISDIPFVGRLVGSWDDSKEYVIKRTIKEEPAEEFEGVDVIITQLEKQNVELEKRNKELEEKLQELMSKLSDTADKKPGFYEHDSDGKKSYNASNILRGKKKKRQEFEMMNEEMDKREMFLRGLEAQINQDKKVIGMRRNEFILWRKKLELLEEEIENRHIEIEKQANLLNIRLSSFKDADVYSEETSVVDEHPALDELDDCAIVIQRGILKQANSPFANLLGYNIEEILNKSLLDFIGPEGFSGIESYYLKRLKGEDATIYETVFLTKDNNKIYVEVRTRPTNLNGEKAEIAFIKKLESKE